MSLIHRGCQMLAGECWLYRNQRRAVMAQAAE